MDSIINRPLEIVGINKGDFGRICEMHHLSCGSSLEIGCHLKIKKEVIQITNDFITIENHNINNKVSKQSKGKKQKMPA